MKIARVRWVRFRIPFVNPFVTSHETTRFRDGLLLWCESDTGLVGLGEISPVPSFGGGTVDDAVRVCERFVPRLAGLDIATALDELPARFWKLPGGRAVSCGLDVALSGLLSQEAGVGLATWLRRQWSNSTLASSEDAINVASQPATWVPVNATIGAGDVDAAVDAARTAVQSGYSCLKLKVGVLKSVDDEANRVAAVRVAIGSDVALRLDANEAWDVETAIHMIRTFERFNVALVEQPVAAVDVQGMARVRSMVSIPIAADEAMRSLHDVRTIIAEGAADVLILKPMITGGLRVSQQIMILAQRAGIACIITTTIDTGIGCAAALHLAASFPPPVPPCGLATASFLEHDLLTEPLAVKDGTMAVQSGPGLGVVLCQEALERYQVAP